MGLGRIKISNFLNKLYDLLGNKKYFNDIHWSQDGNSFIIQNFQNFCYNIMPKVFGLKLFSSFHHQLNCYGFYKIKEQEYYNKNFTRNDRNLLIKIKRKKKKKIYDKIIKVNNTDLIQKIEFEINLIENKRKQLENNLYIVQKRREYLIKENKFLQNKLIESQTKQKDLGYIFFSMVENLFPEFSFIKKQCLYFINSNSSNSSITNLQNNSLEKITNNFLSKNPYKIESGLSFANTQDTKTREEFDNFMDVE